VPNVGIRKNAAIKTPMMFPRVETPFNIPAERPAAFSRRSYQAMHTGVILERLMTGTK
jgi:hypothetical protein